jgi:hypothetical protein
MLTPGDFHVVRKTARLDATPATPEELVERLDYEVRMKNEGQRTIGLKPQR